MFSITSLLDFEEIMHCHVVSELNDRKTCSSDSAVHLVFLNVTLTAPTFQGATSSATLGAGGQVLNGETAQLLKLP